jgi:hypothetical protein
VDRAQRAFDGQLAVVSLAGVAATVLFAPPGRYSVGVGPVAVDPFYAFFVWFVAVGVWSGVGLWTGRDRSDDRTGPDRNR